MDLNKRVGKFYISKDTFEHYNKTLLNKIFDSVFIVRCEYHFESNRFQYFAFSEKFEIIQEGCLLPEYYIIVNKTVDDYYGDSYEIEWKRFNLS